MASRRFRGVDPDPDPSPDPDPTAEPEALSVGELTRDIKSVIEGLFPRVRVHGEVIGLTRARSGHVYFTLKDDAEGVDAQIAAVLWKMRALTLRFPLEDGMHVVVDGRLVVYEPRGSYQIVAETVRPAGEGTLLRALERLKQRLFQEGLFDPARKRPLPFLPRRIGVITSPTGAAVHDVLRAIHRKFPAWVRIFPVRVQGDGAADEIVAALALLAASPGLVDVVILARGGGSLEDLWAFNEEKVARAVASCPVPTICGVGHEIDTTLADLAADVRAQTPTHAGELVVPAGEDLARRLEQLLGGLDAALDGCLERAVQRLERVGQWLASRHPGAEIRRFEAALDSLGNAYRKALYNRFCQWEDLLAREAGRLEALSPMAVLARGYAVVTLASVGEDSPGQNEALPAPQPAQPEPLPASREPRGAGDRRDVGSIVRSARQVRPGDRIAVALGEGELEARVTVSRAAPADREETARRQRMRKHAE